jgi:hypothetical protein
MRNATVREGILAGVIGATSVVLWFLLVDVTAGRPLRTPAMLGRAAYGVTGELGHLYFSLFGHPLAGAPDVPFVIGYTGVHYFAFILAGLLVAVIVQWAETEPTVLAGALVFFVMFEVGFHGLLSAFRAFPVLGVLAWQNVAIGNLVAAIAMGTYMWRTHPALREELRYALESKE